MQSNVGIWLDHQKAVIVYASSDRVAAKTLDSNVGAHPHFGGSQVGGGEKKYEERFDHALTKFYEQVIAEVGQPEAVFIFGPGEAKRQLEHQLTRHKVLSGTPVNVETAGTMTEPQIIARVKEYFEIAR